MEYYWKIFWLKLKYFVDQLNISLHKLAVLLLFYVTRPISTARGHLSADRFHNTKHKTLVSTIFITSVVYIIIFSP